ncbi:hypothetical protein [Micrococcus luteus]|uniref:hypothetical protein n=1 Tax=Micrococcus luteus TaxID=1270 RepID=UPI003D33FFB0
MKRLNEIEARANAATEGPWEASMDRVEHAGDSEYAVAYDVAREEDAEFIAHARTDVPALVAALRAVLELHKHHAGRGGEHCGRCFPDEWGWPCATVAAIRQHLGEDA